MVELLDLFYFYFPILEKTTTTNDASATGRRAQKSRKLGAAFGQSCFIDRNTNPSATTTSSACATFANAKGFPSGSEEKAPKTASSIIAKKRKECAGAEAAKKSMLSLEATQRDDESECDD